MAEIALRRALCIIILSTLAFTGSAASYLYGPRLLHSLRSQQSRYTLTNILQQPVGEYSLPSAMLIEMLSFTDKTQRNLYAYDLKAATELLATLPIFTSLELAKRLPNTLVITYSLRSPIARLRDYTNTAVDSNGVLFPLHPYYKGEELPYITVGHLPALSVKPWGQKLPAKTTQFLTQFLPVVTEFAAEIRCSSWSVDLRPLYNNALGEIALILEEQPSRLLRLTRDQFPVQLRHYASLHPFLSQLDDNGDATVVDLRLTDAVLLGPLP